MNRIEDLYVKPKKFYIGEDKNEVELTPLSIDELDLFEFKKDQDPIEFKKQIIKLLSRVMKVDETQIKNISVEYMEELFLNVVELHKIKGNKRDELVNKLKDKLKNGQA